MNVPGRDTVPGIDVSWWQGSIFWPMVASDGEQFAFIKASGGDGGLYRDGKFLANASGATAAGIPWGPYHFASRARFDPEDEARWFADQIRGTAYTLPPVLDWEPSPGIDGTVAYRWVLAFCEELERLVGVHPIIYTGAYVSLDRGPGLLTYDLWLAAYTAQPIRCPPWPTWSIWQHGSTGRVAGIAGNVDENITDRSWLEAHTGNPTPTTPPEEGFIMDETTKKEMRALLREMLAETVGQWEQDTRAILRGAPVVRLDDAGGSLWLVAEDAGGNRRRYHIPGPGELELLQVLGIASTLEPTYLPATIWKDPGNPVEAIENPRYNAFMSWAEAGPPVIEVEGQVVDVGAIAAEVVDELSKRLGAA